MPGRGSLRVREIFRQHLPDIAIASPQSGTKSGSVGLTAKEKSREDAMANLIIQDTFEPYYAGRDDDAKRRAKPRTSAKKQSGRPAESEIVLPERAPAPAGEVRRDRRVVSH
jgi:hypothetical protein